MEKFYSQLINTAENIQVKIVSDDHCCKLLAWLYIYGGGDEAVVKNIKLKENIMIAQKRANLLGGKIPNQQLVSEIRKYLKSSSKDWILEICKYYNLRLPTDLRNC